MPSDHSTPPRGREPGAPRTPEDEELAKLLGPPAHPTMVRLDHILKNSDAASHGELEHIAICPDCVARVKAFRRMNDTLARRSFGETLECLHRSSLSTSKHARAAETDARIFYFKLEDDSQLDRWQHDAWRCSHTIARALRQARADNATIDDLKSIIQLRVAALGAGAANPMVACSSRFDAAWPIAEMMKEAAMQTGFINPLLFDTFARSAAAAVADATPKMKVGFLFATIELLDRCAVPPALAIKMIGRFAADASPVTRIVLGALIHRRLPIARELNSVLSADFVNEPRVHAGFRTLVRRWHKTEQILNDETITLHTGIDRILAIVRRYVNDVLDADQPDETLLRLIAFRRFLDRTGRYRPDKHFPMAELFRAIGRLLVSTANERHGSTYLMTKALEVLGDADPNVYSHLADLLPSVRPVVRQALVTCVAAAYEATFHATLQAQPPTFIKRDHRLDFVAGGSGRPLLDRFCRRAAEEADAHPEINTHLEWMRNRMEMWTAPVPVAVRS